MYETNRKPFFSGVELYVSYDWWATAPNMHHSLFLICHFVHISSITPKLQSACNSSTYKMTPLLLRMLCFVLKAAKQLQTTRYSPVQMLLSFVVLCNNKWQQNPWHPQLYYTSNNYFLTNIALFRSTKWGTTYELPIQLLLWCLCTTCRLC